MSTQNIGIGLNKNVLHISSSDVWQIKSCKIMPVVFFSGPSLTLKPILENMSIIRYNRDRMSASNRKELPGIVKSKNYLGYFSFFKAFLVERPFLRQYPCY